MKKWIVKFNDTKTVDHLESLGILSHKPMFFDELKFVFIQTDKTEEEILEIEGNISCRKQSVGTVWV
jgi:hypothetical protein